MGQNQRTPRTSTGKCQLCFGSESISNQPEHHSCACIYFYNSVESLALGYISNIPKINIILNQEEIGEGLSTGPKCIFPIAQPSPWKYSQTDCFLAFARQPSACALVFRCSCGRFAVTRIKRWTKVLQIARYYWLIMMGGGLWWGTHIHSPQSHGPGGEEALNDGGMPNRERKRKRDMEEHRRDNRSPLISQMGSWLESRSTKTGNSSSYRQHQ